MGVDALASLKMDPTRQFYLHASRSKRYDYQSLTNMALPHWNSGHLLDPTCADYKAWVQDFVSRAENKLEARASRLTEEEERGLLGNIAMLKRRLGELQQAFKQ